jgi:hypothetical protein
MAETQHIDIDEERLMHGVVLAHGGLHSHGASHEIGSGCFMQSSYLIKDLMSRLFFLLTFTFTLLPPFLLYPLSETRCG